MQEETSIILIDDHTIVRNGLKSLIEVLGNYKVIAEYDNGKQFVNATPLPQADLIILDLNMPEMNGEQTMTWLRKNKPDLKVLILTLDTDDKTIIALYRAGVRGYIPKSCDASVLKKAIDSIIHTGYYHNDLLQHALIADAEKTEQIKKTTDLLLEREMVFLQLICDPEEYTYDQIATIMNVSKRTIDGYKLGLTEKFNIKSKTGLVLFAIKHGVVQL